jgi:hypothetical protein
VHCTEGWLTFRALLLLSRTASLMAGTTLRDLKQARQMATRAIEKTHTFHIMENTHSFKIFQSLLHGRNNTAGPESSEVQHVL